MLFSGCFGAGNGDKAPDFGAKLIDGTDFRLSDLKGQYVVLDFWGSWCGPCRRQNPSLVALYQKYKNDISVVSVALEKFEDHWQAATKADGITWKYQIVEQSAVVLASPIARAYGVLEIPATFLIRPDGTVVTGLSPYQIDQLLSAELNK